jgi:hypothetical protein
MIVAIIRTMGQLKYLAVPCFGISVFCLCCSWLHTPRAGCHTSRWVLELVHITVIYYAQKAEISSQVASTFFCIWGRAPSFSFLYVPSFVIGCLNCFGTASYFKLMSQLGAALKTCKVAWREWSFDDHSVITWSFVMDNLETVITSLLVIQRHEQCC